MYTDVVFPNVIKSFAKHYEYLTECDFLVITDVKRVRRPDF